MDDSVWKRAAPPAVWVDCPDLDGNTPIEFSWEAAEETMNEPVKYIRADNIAGLRDALLDAGASAAAAALKAEGRG